MNSWLRCGLSSEGVRTMGKARITAVLAAALAVSTAAHGQPAGPALTLKEALSYSFVTGIVSAEHADRIAWARDVEGVRNIWVAAGPAFAARPVTHSTADDGQEL